MSIILLRHGETLLNVARTLQPADTPLAPSGHAQAAAVAARLAALRPAALWSSDLPRAWQTAQAVSAATGLVITPQPAWQERNFGTLRGQPWDAIGVDPFTVAEAPPGGESEAAFHERVAAAFASAAEHHATLAGPLVVVTHGLVIRAVLLQRLGLRETAETPLRLGNTSVTVIGAGPVHRIERLNCTAHLEAAG